MSAENQDSQHLLKLARSFHTKKKLGQHFLVSAEALAGIVDALDIEKDEKILEIGPGIGFLTGLLCSKSSQVTAVELDRESVDYLKKLKLPGLSIKHGDFLSYDIASGRFRQDDSKGWSEPDRKERIKIVGNVPYQITGLIIGKLLGEISAPAEHLCQIDRIVLTVQKEVADRMVAVPGSKNYAQLSLLISYFCDAQLVMDLPAEKFFPPPKVDSAVVKLTPLPAPRIVCKNPKLLRRTIKAGFAQRRKMLRNALTSLAIAQEDLNRVFKELQFDPQVRAESLSLQQFAVLADALSEKLQLVNK